MTRQRLLRRFRWTAGIVLALALITVTVVIGLLRASLPKLDGQVRAAGLRDSVTIERDHLGVPTITASNRLDVIYGLGFVRGQDRFFGRILSRRAGKVELAELASVPARAYEGPPHDNVSNVTAAT